jgi:hypothetical protein
MMEAERQALAIYALICETSGNRPTTLTRLNEMNQQIAEWRGANPALTILRAAQPAVHLAFLAHSFEWLQVKGKVTGGGWPILQTMNDAITFSLEAWKDSLPSELVFQVIAEMRQDHSLASMFFPFDRFLFRVTKKQMTDEIRAELRKIYVQLEPSPTGKIEPRAQLT